MQNRNTLYAAIIIVLILLVGGTYFFYKRQIAIVPTEQTVSTSTPLSASSTSQTATSTTGETITAVGPDGQAYTMNIVPIGERPETPNYKRDLIFDASVNAAARTSLQAQFTAAKALLAKDSSDFNAWLSIGNIRLIGGDAAGAKEIWDYASKVWPTNQVTFNNLGDYYVNYQKDYAKAEANYLIAIKNKPTDPSAYRSLFGLYYTTGYKRTGTTAEDILKKGIAASPSTVDLQVLLARYYRDTGRKTEAKAEFNVAIATAQSSSQSSVVTALQTERDAF